MRCGVKVFDPASRKYRPGLTVDVSLNGALIDVVGGVHSHVGDELMLAIDWTGTRALAPASSMIPVRVTRIKDGEETALRLAVEFEYNQMLPLAA
jgi:hypothetical protein